MSNRTKHIAIHVTPSEYAVIQKMASDDGRSISEWGRLRIIRAEPPRDPDEELARQERVSDLPKALPIVDAPLPRVASTTDAEISPGHREIIQRHREQTIREFKPFSKSDQAGRKPRKTP